MSTLMEALALVKSTKPLDDDYIQRFSEAAVAGDTIVQGDVYLTKIDKPMGAPMEAVAQIAPGTTRGSRHILSSLEGIRMYKYGETELDGPVIEVTKEVTLTHPEHKHTVLTPGCYRVTYQRKHADELRRQQD